jgi:hypothetical protein
MIKILVERNGYVVLRLTLYALRPTLQIHAIR